MIAMINGPAHHRARWVVPRAYSTSVADPPPVRAAEVVVRSRSRRRHRRAPSALYRLEAVRAMSMEPDEVAARTRTYRDVVGMAALVTGRGDSGFHEFDEWLAAVTESVDPVCTCPSGDGSLAPKTTWTVGASDA